MTGNAAMASDEMKEVQEWMFANSYATGHGETIADMLVELEGQVRERAFRESAADLEECAMPAGAQLVLALNRTNRPKVARTELNYESQRG